MVFVAWNDLVRIAIWRSPWFWLLGRLYQSISHKLMGSLQICSSDFLRILDELMQQYLLFNRCYQVFGQFGGVFLFRLLCLVIGYSQMSLLMFLVLLRVFPKFYFWLVLINFVVLFWHGNQRFLDFRLALIGRGCGLFVLTISWHRPRFLLVCFRPSDFWLGGHVLGLRVYTNMLISIVAQDNFIRLLVRLLFFALQFPQLQKFGKQDLDLI